MSQQKMTITLCQTTNDNETPTLIDHIGNRIKQYPYLFKCYKNSTYKPNSGNLEPHILNFINNMHQSKESLEDIEKTLVLLQNPVPNTLLLLKIKLMILLAKTSTLLQTPSEDKKYNTYSLISELKRELTKQANVLNIKNDPIQRDIAFALRVVHNLSDAGKLGYYDVALWDVVQWKLGQQFDNNFAKLDLFKALANFTSDKTITARVDKDQFYAVYKAMDERYGTHLQDNSLSLEERLDYLKATFMVYSTYVNTHPTIKKYNPSKYQGLRPQPVEPLLHIFNIWETEGEKYIKKLDAARKTLSVEAFLDDLDALLNYQQFLASFYQFMQNQLKDLLFIHSYLLKTNNDNELLVRYFMLIVQVLQFFREFHQQDCRLEAQIQKELKDLSLFKLATSGEEIEKKYLSPDVLKNFQTLHALTQTQLIKSQIATEEAMTQLIVQSSKTKQKSTQPVTNHNAARPIANTTIVPTPKITKKATKKPVNKAQKRMDSASLALSKKQYHTAIEEFENAKKQALTKEEQLAALDGLICAKQKQTLDSLSHINLDYGFSKCNLKDSKLRLSHATDMLFSLETLYKEFDQLGKTKAHLDLNRSLLQEDRLKIEEKINQLMLIKAQKLSLKDKKPTPIIPIETYPSSRVIDKSQFPELPLVVEDKPKQEVIYNPQHMTVPLFLELEQAFEFLKPIKGSHYLVGSMVLRLLEGPQSKIVPTDLDFLSLQSKSEDWIKSGNFRQNSAEKRLLKSTNWKDFTTFRPLEIWLEEDKSLEESLLSRDFTIAALACTNEGVIIDPTGFGFDDLAQKRLRMIGDPTLRFEHSPSILLRVIKYRLLDFKIDDNIIKALMAWQPSKSTNLIQLQVLCEKMLKNTNKLVFAAYLITYQLASKIYNLSVELSCDALVALMENSRKHNAAQYKGSFFSNSPSTEEKNLSLEQDNLALSKDRVNASKFDQSL